MAMLELVSEEHIEEESINEYFDDLYRVICVGERAECVDASNGVVRSTYIVDWEQLVHLLEEYSVFGEDIVEVTAIDGDEARILRRMMGGAGLARA